MIDLPLWVKQASESTINTLISIGTLYVGETGTHANEPGVYPKTEEIPTQTANPSGDE